ncbi:MAG: helix-turn-helix transcriptional regulator [Phycisphaerales bacterium]|nr:helix-turn-helix transcriptional regulator [Phycisphaerales bacterium]
MAPDDLDRIFTALAHPTRRRLLELLRETPGSTIADLARVVDLSGVGVLKHVRILEQAGLIHAQPEGRRRRLYFNVMPIQLVYDHWTDEYSRFWAGRVSDLKERLESRTQSPRSRRQRRA